MSRQTHKAKRRLIELADNMSEFTPAVLREIARRGQFAAIPDGYAWSTARDGMPRGRSEYSGCEAAADRRGFAGTDEVPFWAPDKTGEWIRDMFLLLWEAGNAASGIVHPGVLVVGPVAAGERALAAVRQFAKGTTEASIDRAAVGDPLFAQLAAVSTAVSKAAARLKWVGDTRHGAKDGRVSVMAGPCQACGRDVAGTELDRLLAGYCGACYQRWYQTAPVFADGSRGSRQDRNRFERERRQQLAVLDEKEMA